MMPVYVDKCRVCGAAFQNSDVQRLRFCSLGCEWDAMTAGNVLGTDGQKSEGPDAGTPEPSDGGG